MVTNMISQLHESFSYGAVLVSKLRSHFMIIILLFYVVVHTFTDAESHFLKVSFCEGLKFQEAHELVPILACFRDKSVHKSVKRKLAGYGNKSPYCNVKNSWTYVFVCLHSTDADRIPDVSPFMTITFFEREKDFVAASHMRDSTSLKLGWLVLEVEGYGFTAAPTEKPDNWPHL